MSVGLERAGYTHYEISNVARPGRESRHNLTYWQDGDWYVGRLVEVPEVFSQGETLLELQENIQDAYDLMVR